MAEEANQTEQKLAGLPAGVSAADLNEGENGNGPAAPVINNKAPAKEETAEEKTARETKEAADAQAATDKEAADKKAAEDAEAAKKAAEEGTEEEAKEYAVYNDESADSAISLLKEAGVKPADADKFFAKAIESGKLEDIDVKGLTDAVGKEKANLIMLGVKDYYGRVTANVTAVTKSVYEVTGGEAQFNTLRDWALEKEKTDGEFGTLLNEYRSMLDGTPVQAKLAAEALLKAYTADPKTKSLNVTITHGDSTTSSGLDLQYISRADYTAQMKAAHDKKDSAEVARLRSRRSASMTKEKSRTK